jgi:hypothetical protein
MKKPAKGLRQEELADAFLSSIALSCLTDGQTGNKAGSYFWQIQRAFLPNLNIDEIILS